MLSVILPSYNEEKMIAKATARMAEILQPEKIDYELLFIDDGSRDGTWAQINEAAEKDSHVVGVHFSRNFGKEAAMFAGLEQARGDCCVVIDCDLQHPPEKIVEMYRLWEQGYEVVEGKIAIADIMAAAREGKLEEVFGTGTAAVVSPVKELVWKGEHAYIGDGKIGPVTQKLYDTMTGMQWGKIPDTKGWIVPVEKKY